jgi:hypothetical protein
MSTVRAGKRLIPVIPLEKTATRIHFRTVISFPHDSQEPLALLSEVCKTMEADFMIRVAVT